MPIVLLLYVIVVGMFEMTAITPSSTLTTSVNIGGFLVLVVLTVLIRKAPHRRAMVLVCPILTAFVGYHMLLLHNMPTLAPGDGTTLRLLFQECFGITALYYIVVMFSE
jgi:hypothetical protein